jgi:guanyl-specific ribonuclease Sa
VPKRLLSLLLVFAFLLASSVPANSQGFIDSLWNTFTGNQNQQNAQEDGSYQQPNQNPYGQILQQVAPNIVPNLPFHLPARLQQAGSTLINGNLAGNLRIPSALSPYVSQILNKTRDDMATKLGEQLGMGAPLQFKQETAFPIVAPPTNFNPVHLKISTVQDMVRPLPPGDYSIDVAAFCSRSSIHVPGKGIPQKIGPMLGTQAKAISALLVRGTFKGVDHTRLMAESWRIQAGLPISQWPPEDQKLAHQLIPDYENGLQGNILQRIPSLNVSLINEIKRQQQILSDKTFSVEHLPDRLFQRVQGDNLPMVIKANNPQASPWQQVQPGVLTRFTVIDGWQGRNLFEFRITPYALQNKVRALQNQEKPVLVAFSQTGSVQTTDVPIRPASPPTYPNPYQNPPNFSLPANDNAPPWVRTPPTNTNIPRPIGISVDTLFGGATRFLLGSVTFLVGVLWPSDLGDEDAWLRQQQSMSVQPQQETLPITYSMGEQATQNLPFVPKIEPKEEKDKEKKKDPCNSGGENFASLPQKVIDAYQKYDSVNWSGNFPWHQNQATRAGGAYYNRSTPKLPDLDRKGNPLTYQEFDVNDKAPTAKTRDAERFVRGNDCSVWYTDTHYKSWIRIK